MQLKNDEKSWFEINSIIQNYYQSQGRDFYAFRSPNSTGGDFLEFCFLIDRKHVAKYIVSFDRGGYLGGLFLAIGPQYFSPNEFWSYENSQRFTLDADAHGVVKNLGLLDEFLGY